MATHYIENGSSGNQYYFDANSSSTSQTQKSAQDRTYASPISTTTPVGSSEFSPYPTGVAGVRSQHQQIRSERNTYHEDDSYQLPQQHQSVAGFSKTVSQQQYQASPSSAPQVRATVRSVTSQEQQQQQQQQAYVNYEQQASSQPPQISPQQQQYQYDSRQQAGQPISPSAYYQAPGPAQYLPHELDQRTESPSRSRDQHAQAQQVLVRAVSNSAHQQQQQHAPSQVSPQQTQQPQQQNQDQLQQYYSQLTPEQYQQLLRQQQIQRQQQEEQKRQQLAQQQYYLQQQQERQRVEQQQQQQQYQPSRSNQDSPIYDEYQQRRVPPNPPNQEQQYRQQGQDQYDAHQQRSQRVHGSVSPNVNQDPYRQQQHQGQQSQLDAYHEQQRRAAAQQSSSSSTYQQEQYRSTVGADGGQQYQQVSPNQQQQGRTDSERQRQEEQEYYAAQLVLQQQQERAAQIEAAQRQQAAQRAQQQQQQQQQQYQEQQQQQIIQSQQPAQPVGIRGLMNKFTGPTTIPTYEPKAKTTTSQHYSSSSYTSPTGSGQTTTTRSSTIHAMTYSALPKPQEPPVNSAEYYQLMQGGNTSNTSSNIQQPTAPPHIQGPAPGFGALRDRFKSGSTSESTNPIQDIRRQQLSNTNNSGLSSLRDQYINRAKESTQIQEESFSQRIQHVSRSIVGGENQPQQQQTPPAPPSTPQVPQQQEDSPVQSQSVDDQAASSEGAVADGGSSSGASPLESDAPLAATAVTPATSSN